MPIDPEWKTLYPENWDAISLEVREAAGQCCEWCRVPNHITITRHDQVDAWTLETDPEELRDAQWFDSRGDEIPTPNIVADHWLDEDDWNVRAVDVVLTVAHLDHDPRNCERSNLRALCQSCHITYDKNPVQRRKREMLRAELLHGQQSLI